MVFASAMGRKNVIRVSRSRRLESEKWAAAREDFGGSAVEEEVCRFRESSVRSQIAVGQASKH